MIDVEKVVEFGRMGLRCFPTHGVVSGKCTCGEAECRRPGKHPRTKGYKSKASSDAGEIRKLFRHYFCTNAAFIAGEQSGVFAVDVDGEEGKKSWDKLQSENSPVPTTYTVTSGRAFSFHLWFKYPTSGTVRPGRQLAPGIDIRGEGDAVTLPGSTHVSRKVYTAQDETAEIATAPDWLLRMVTAEDTTTQTISKKRNPAVFKEAGKLFRAGVEPEEVRELIHAFNATRCNPPLPEAEVDDILKRVEEKFDPDFVEKQIEEKPARLPWFKVYAEEVLTSMDSQSLLDYELGQRLRLMCTAWMNGGTLTSDLNALARIARASDVAAFKANWKRILYDFKKKDGVLVNDTLAEEFGGAQVIITKRRKAGQEGQRKKLKEHVDTLRQTLPTEQPQLRRAS